MTQKVDNKAKTDKMEVTASPVVDEVKPVDTKLPKLRGKQGLFAQEYTIDLHATKAALRAGYAARSAQQIGSENLLKPVIQAEIQRLMSERSERTQITADNVVLELAKIGFCNIEDFAKIEGAVVKFTDFKEVGKEKLAAVESIGSTKKGKITLKLHSKLNALEQLGKHLGIYEKDNAQKAQTIFDILAIVGVKNV